MTAASRIPLLELSTNNDTGRSKNVKNDIKYLKPSEHEAPMASSSSSSSQTASEGGSTASSELERERLVRVSRMAKRKLKRFQVANQELEAEKYRLQVRS
jgi:hypothetical protein